MLANHITLPCGCAVTFGYHAMLCITHENEMRELKNAREREYQEFLRALRTVDGKPEVRS